MYIVNIVIKVDKYDVKNMYVLSILVLKNSIPEIIIGITNTIIIAAKILIFNPIADNTLKTNKLATKLKDKIFHKITSSLYTIIILYKYIFLLQTMLVI